MNAEFNWWLLIVGLVVGAGLVWLVIADWSRREEDLSDDERIAESEWIAEALRARGEPLDVAAAEEVLALHREYLRQAGLMADEDERDPAETAPTEPPAWSEPEPGLWLTQRPAQPDRRGPAETYADDGRPPAQDDRTAKRRSVRARPMAPRGGAAGMESDPPRT
jgi:hypothetical protein